MPIQQATASAGETFQISFVITYYNIPLDMLRQCVESILALALQPSEREIILVDDGSPISPVTLVDSYPTAIRYIRQSNKGVAEARNAGLSAAQGTHVQFVDADDYLLCEGYNHCIDIVRNNRDIDLLAIDFTQRTNINHNAAQETLPTDGADYMLQHNLRGIDWAYLFRRSIIGDLRFHPGLLHEDEEFVPRLFLQAHNVVATTAVAYYYRRRADSIVHSEDKAHVHRRLSDMLQIISRLQDIAHTLPSPRRQALFRRVHQLTMDHIYNTIRLVDSEEMLESTVEQLRSRELFPLPPNDYTLKYKWFRRISTTKFGRKLMFWLLK